LTTEGSAELAIDERRPKNTLWRRNVSAHCSGALSEKSLTLSGNGASAQVSLPGPAKRPAAATPAQAPCQAPAVERFQRVAWRGACAPGEGQPRPGLGLGRRAPERRPIDPGAFEEQG
jgi:hypothetical protein